MSTPVAVDSRARENLCQGQGRCTPGTFQDTHPPRPADWPASSPTELGDGFGATLKDHFPEDAPDTEWLAYIGTHDFFLITRDDNIRRNPAEIKALRIIGAQGRYSTRPKLEIDFAAEHTVFADPAFFAFHVQI